MSSTEEEEVLLRHDQPDSSRAGMFPSLDTLSSVLTYSDNADSMTEIKSHSSQTEVKVFGKCGDKSIRNSDGVNERPPSYDTSVQQTEVKTMMVRYVGCGVGSADASTCTRDIFCRNLAFNDAPSVQEAIELLKQQQDEIKRMQCIHEQHLKQLLDSQPTIQQHLQSIHQADIAHAPDVGSPSLPVPTLPPKLFMQQRTICQALLDDKMYVQLEQLYVNAKIYKTTAFGSAGNNGFYDDALKSEISALKEANRLLRDKVSDLERRLHNQDAQGRLGLHVPDLPWSFGSGMKASKSLNGLNDSGIGQNTITKAVAGRPTSPLPPPLLLHDIRPIEMTFKWTITDYTRKLRDEKKNGTKEASCPFYLSHCGYKAQMEAYLNGNGTAKNRCISVFLRIIKGEYDRHLKWPVNLHVVVIMVNQSENRSDSLKAGGNLFQYQQPHGTSDMESDSWGLVEFVKLDVIRTRQYIRDDKIVLKCRVTILA